jgi:protein ImuA
MPPIPAQDQAALAPLPPPQDRASPAPTLSAPAALPSLLNGRVHEAEGRGRAAFALFQACRLTGPVFWVLPAHQRDRPLPSALAEGLCAALIRRLYLVETKGETDLLWTVEEVLRSQPVALVVAEPEKPISLTAGRRLQLAAEAGQTTGLMLIRNGAGSNATETRWICEPSAAPAGRSHHHWQLAKNKKGSTAGFTLDWDGGCSASLMPNIPVPTGMTSS